MSFPTAAKQKARRQACRQTAVKSIFQQLTPTQAVCRLLFMFHTWYFSSLFYASGAVTLAPLLTFIDDPLYHFCSLFCHCNPVEQDESWFYIIIHWLSSTGNPARLLQVSETFKVLYLFGRQGPKLPSCFADIHKIF